MLLMVVGAQRYFFLPGAIIALAAVVTIERHERAGLLVGALFIVGAVADFRPPPH